MPSTATLLAPGRRDTFTQVAAEISGTGPRIAIALNGVVSHYGLLLQTEVRARASYPRSQDANKPRIQTGDYVRSISLSVSGLTATVGTNRPQARRLEYGFSGVDSLGRHYDQPPYEHWGPAVDHIRPQFIVAANAAVSRSL